MGIWFTQGTASCEHGSTSVTGTLTAWNNQVKAGDSFRFIGDGEPYQIAADATANTAFTLSRPYEGETKTNAAFEIIPISVRRQEVPTLCYRVDQMLNQLATLVNTTGKPDDSFGANGTLAIDKPARLMYQKNDGHWDSGTSLGGPGYGGLSSDSATINNDPKSFAVGSGYAYAVGSRVRAIAIGSSPLAWVEGEITSYDDGEIAFTADRKKGTGTFGDWILTLVGDPGLDAWSPTLALDTDGARVVQKITDWVGGTGSKPATGKYIGASGLVDTKAEAVDVRGAPGSDGTDGWSPVFALDTDGERRVQKITNWVGGEGTKPATGKYIGLGGLVDTKAEAVDIRGPIGATGPASLTWAGAFDDETTYHVNDVVQFEGSTWQTIAESTGNTPPSLPTTENAYFSLIAAKGDQGDPGTPGEPGTDGADGTNFSPNATGEFSDRDDYDAEVGGFVFLSLDGDGEEITTAVLFIKQPSPGVWSAPVLFQGPPGPAGIAWRGDYAADVEYNQNDGVQHQGGSWRAKKTTVGNAPPTLPTTEDANWKLLARPGNDSVTSYNDLTDRPTLGSAAAHAAGDFASAAQGAKADSAVQPEDIGSAALHAAADFATSAQGAKADTALQSFNVAATVHAAAEKATLVDVDEFALIDSAASFVLKRLTWANLKGAIKAYFNPREVLAGSRTYYVRSDGNDTNTGRVNNAGGAFKTTQKAMDTIAALDIGIYNAIIQYGDTGPFTGCLLKAPVGAGTVIINGDTGNPSAYTITKNGGSAYIFDGQKAVGNFQISGVHPHDSSANYHIISGIAGNNIVADNNDYGDAINYLLASKYGGMLQVTGANNKLSCSGTITAPFLCDTNSNLIAPSTTKFTWLRNISFAYFAFARWGGVLNLFNLTCTLAGFTATGSRYSSDSNGIIIVGGGGESFFPGSTSGTRTNGGMYS